MKVLAYDIFKVEGLENENMKYVEMDELLANSDFVSVHTPSIDGKPLINEATIAQDEGWRGAHQHLPRQQCG